VSTIEQAATKLMSRDRLEKSLWQALAGNLYSIAMPEII